jgi:hypothetical protein
MIRLQAWPLQTILVTDWLISKKSSPLKLLSQMNRNLVGSIYGRSSIKISYFVMIRLQAKKIIGASKKLVTGLNGIMVHLDKQYQRRRFFRNQPISNKNGPWWPCLW